MDARCWSGEKRREKDAKKKKKKKLRKRKQNHCDSGYNSPLETVTQD